MIKTIKCAQSAGLGVATLLMGNAAFAHPGHGDVSDLMTGLAHPFSGVDHVLAMVAVGIWAAQMGRNAMLTLPLAFPLLMVVGAVGGSLGLGFSGVETGIAFSSLLLGILVLAKAQLKTVFAALMVGMLALFHGYAHGAEMPATVTGIGYGVGFVLGTLALHGVGLALGSLHRSWAGDSAMRGIGAGIAGAGALMLMNAVA